MTPSTPLSPLDVLQARLGYRFRDVTLLERAVTHPSYLQHRPEITESNQRMEFLGDAVLQLIITEALFGLFPADREGQLSKQRASLAKGVFLAELALEIGLAECLRLSASEEVGGGRFRGAALEDALEALVASIYLDSDFPTTRQVVLGLYGPLSDRLEGVHEIDNPKGRLQELVQPKHGNHALRYELVSTEGRDHAREFEVAAFLLDEKLGSGRGTSKKLAEEAAARVALELLRGRWDAVGDKL